jgi:predicted DNA-binding transcriptional regulator AlpA
MGYARDTTVGIHSAYLTKSELAAELRVRVRTLDRLKLRGEFPPRTRIGRASLFRRNAVLQWLGSLESQPVDCATIAPSRKSEPLRRAASVDTAGAQGCRR